MAKTVLKTVDIVVNGVNLSTHGTSAVVEDTADEVDVTGFQEPYREFDQGLKDANITVTFLQDFAAGQVDATLYPLYSAGTSFTVVVKATSAVVSATNPSYTMTARLYSYSPISGGVGDASTMDVTFRNASQTGIVRATA